MPLFLIAVLLMGALVIVAVIAAGVVLIGSIDKKRYEPKSKRKRKGE